MAKNSPDISTVAKRIPLEKKSIGKLKALLDKEISTYIRNLYSKDGENVECFTCGAVRPIKATHCGHYIPRTQSPTRYSESNLRPQCPGCNTFRSGMPHVFRENLCLEIGDFAVEEMEKESKQPWKWDRFDLLAKIAYYKELNKV